MTSPLAFLPLRYLIGKDADEGQDGTVTVVGYDAPSLPSRGIAAGYINPRDEKNVGTFGPYLPADDISAQYSEPAPVFDTEGFWGNYRPQLSKWASLGTRYTETDNLDTYSVAAALKMFGECSVRGLSVLVKNAALVRGTQAELLRHPAAVMAIVEKDCGLPANYESMRLAAGKPDLPVRFVAFGDGRAWAQQIAQQIKAGGYADMAVTYSADGEYGSSEDILLPTPSSQPQPSPNPSPMPTPVTGKIIDTAQNVAGNLPHLRAAGIGCVIRYLTTNTASEKCIKPDEARAIAAAGLSLALVFEVWGGSGNFIHNDISAENGAAHGAFAQRYLPQIGAPKGLIVWFAIDTDVTASQIVSFVTPYFRAAKAALPDYRIGVYGPGAACAAMLDQGICDAAWLSNAMGWNGSKEFLASNRWRLLQHLPATVAGLDADPDDANGNDFGAFVPFAGAPVVPAPIQPGALAAKVFAAMAIKGYRIETGARPNIIGIIGMDPDGTPNGNAPDKFNDLRVLIWANADGSIARSQTWICTTDPGKYYVDNRINSGGAAQIAPGQYTAWQVDLYHGEEALCQWAGPITVQRDDNENFKRDSADPLDTGEFGVHWHGPTGHENVLTTVGTASAGCIVARSMPEQREFMAAVKTDERYLADNRFAFTGTILSADEVANAGVPVVQPSPPSPSPAPTQSGKGSWYSQYRGKYVWVDDGDTPGSAALGVPDDAQGVAFYNRATLGQWFAVTAPNGITSIEQQTDIGPSPSTGRLIDISAAAAERFGYSPNSFPTDGIFQWRAVPVPSSVAGLTPQQQATKFYALRSQPQPVPQPLPLPAPTPQPTPVPQPIPQPQPVPVTDVQSAIANVQAKLDDVQASLTMLKEQIAMATQPTSGQLPFSIPDIPDDWVRWAWPVIQRMSAEQIIALKHKILSGQFGLWDLLQILMTGGGQSSLLSAPTTIDLTANAAPPAARPPAPAARPPVASGGLAEVLARPTVKIGAGAAAGTFMASLFGLLQDPMVTQLLYGLAATLAGGGVTGTFKSAAEIAKAQLSK